MNYTKYFIILNIFLFSYASIAQKDIKIGIEIGPNLVSFRGNKIVNNNQSFVRLVTGIVFEYPLSEKFAIKSGLYLEDKGAKFDLIGSSDGLKNSTLTYYFDYVNLPLIIKYKMGDKYKFFINSGLFASSLSKYYYEIDGGIHKNNDYKTKDFGFIAGAGIEIPIYKNIEFMFEARGNLGVINISKAPVVNDGSIKTNSLNILFSINYKI